MSYESAVPVACTLLLGKVIGVTAPDTRCDLAGVLRGDICTLAELPRCCVKPKAAACAWNAGR